ncbi:MAG TPA: vanadium-dependent haloperoxidase [Longimicrobiaceae bacterium]
MRTFGKLALTLGAALAAGCATPPERYRAAAADPELLHGAVETATSAMMVSITSPPVSSRTYAYSSIAAYEAMRPGWPRYQTLAGRVNGLSPVPAPEPGKEILYGIAGTNAFLTVAEKLVFDPELIAAYRDSVARAMRKRGVPRDVLERSLAYGDRVARHVLAWAGEDGIKAARAEPRLTIRREPGLWIPTAPAYMDAVEPNWGTLRPFVLASPGQAAAPPPAPYDVRAGSGFRRLVDEVYRVRRTLTPEQQQVAGFWDCNPYAVQSRGHMVFSTKKISPGGHWLLVTRVALRQTHAGLERSAEAYAKVSMALADGFISAWSEKFRSVRVRPVTVITETVDPQWKPLLQTPPFPEYPSGHSVVSVAAAEVLTDLFGDGFAYTDDTEARFGIAPRRFASFRQAADEAAISRLYGGIHFRDAIEGGKVMGRAVGDAVLSRARTRPAALASAHPAERGAQARQ